MQIATELRLTDAEEKEIAAILGCSPEHLSAKLSDLAAASICEYLTMVRGQKVLKRGSDILEYRLFLLIESAFDRKLPDERTVSSLFQTTLTESRSLLRAVTSKYQYQLRTYIAATLSASLRAAKRQKIGDPYAVVINSHNIVDEMNKRLADMDGNLPPVAKRRGSVSTYEIQPSSYSRLCGLLGVPAER